MLTLKRGKWIVCRCSIIFEEYILFPPGTNPREMQLTGFICGWFSSWPLVINLQAEAEASVSLSHVVYRLCDSAYMILALPLLSEMTLVNECHVLSSIAGDYHQAILECLCPLFLKGGASGPASLAFLGMGKPVCALCMHDLSPLPQL